MASVVSDGIDTREVNDHVCPVDEIAGSVKGQLCFGAEHNLRIKGLLDSFACKVRVLVVSESPKSNTRILSEVFVSSSERDQLSECAALAGRKVASHIVLLLSRKIIRQSTGLNGRATYLRAPKTFSG